MGYCAPNHRGKPLRYIIKPRWGKNLLPSYIFPLTSSLRHHPSDMLPQEFFDVATEGGLLSPAVVFEGLTHVTLDIGRKGTSAVVVFVVTLAGIDTNKVVLDGALDATRHVVIHSGESDGHADGLIIAEPRTTFTLHLRIVKVHALNEHSVLRGICAEDTMKTVLTKWTHGTIANRISISLLFEDLLSSLWGIIFLFHHFLCFVSSRCQFLAAKVNNLCEICKCNWIKSYKSLCISTLCLYIIVYQRII